MEKISACVLTFNESKNVPPLMETLKFCDEILVVDHFSTDDTRSKLAGYSKVRIQTEAFRGFKTQKNRAVDLAQHDWVVCLDADETLDESARKAIQHRLASTSDVFAYRLARKCFYLGKWVRYGGWYPDYQLRFFHRRYGRWQGGETHEGVVAERTEVSVLPGHIIHTSFRDISHQVEKNNFYSSRLASRVTKRKAAIVVGMLTRPIVTFFRMFVWRRGFLDGLVGFIVAVNSAYSTFLKYAKAWERQK